MPRADHIAIHTRRLIQQDAHLSRPFIRQLCCDGSQPYRLLLQGDYSSIGEIEHRIGDGKILRTAIGVDFILVVSDIGALVKFSTSAQATSRLTSLIDFELDPNLVIYDVAAGGNHAAMLALGDECTGYRPRQEAQTMDERMKADSIDADDGAIHKPMRLRGGASNDDLEDTEDLADETQFTRPPENREANYGEVDRNQPWVARTTRPDLPGPSDVHGPRGGAAFRIGFAGRHAVRSPSDASNSKTRIGTDENGGINQTGENGEDAGDSGNRGRAIGNHPNPTGGLRGPAFRVGFAGRHAVERSLGRSASSGADNDQATRKETSQDGSETRGQIQQEEQGGGIGNHVGPGGAMFRIGFAGRGVARGRGDRQVEDEAKGKPW